MESEIRLHHVQKSALTSQRRKFVCVTQPIRLLMSREIIGFDFDNRRQNAESLNVTARSLHAMVVTRL